MSNYLRWQVRVYYSNDDLLPAQYNAAGEALLTDLATDGIPYNTFYVSQIGWTGSPTNELATDITGRPYSKNRGFIDAWNLALTPYYFDPTGAYESVSGIYTNLSLISTRRHLWFHVLPSNGLNVLSHGCPTTKAIKVTFEAWSESINPTAGTRSGNLKLARKFRID
jgi:hypothetical protein